MWCGQTCQSLKTLRTARQSVSVIVQSVMKRLPEVNQKWRGGFSHIYTSGILCVLWQWPLVQPNDAPQVRVSSVFYGKEAHARITRTTYVVDPIKQPVTA